MKRNKGFTLIELLAVLVIFGIICALAIPPILNQVNKNKQMLGDKNIAVIGKAASLYYDNDLKPSSTYCVTLKQLSDQDLLATPVTDYQTGKDYDLSQYVEIKTDMNRKETYKILSKGTTCTPSETTAVTIIMGKNTSGNPEGLITDDTADHNIRYAGSNSVVKNYVTFNNELWRIIGIFDGKIKIIRNEAIGTQAWDSKGGNGVNNYPTSDIKNYLNETYLNSMNNVSKNMIADVTYYLGSRNTSSYAVTKKESYVAERGTTVYTGCSVGTNGETSGTCPRATTWTGKIGLLYPSDYGYAVGSACNTTLDLYNSATCTANNWMYDGNLQWLMTSSSTSQSTVLCISANGRMYCGLAANTLRSVRPVVYLRSHVKILSGNGTQNSPYRLGL